VRRLTRVAAEAGSIVCAWLGVGLIVVAGQLGKRAYASDDVPTASTKIR
jgi:hypothetical protein